MYIERGEHSIDCDIKIKLVEKTLIFLAMLIKTGKFEEYNYKYILKGEFSK
jgi:hypothetical protein